jgi:hypothetical protein
MAIRHLGLKWQGDLSLSNLSNDRLSWRSGTVLPAQQRRLMVTKSRCWVSLAHFQTKSCHLEFWVHPAGLNPEHLDLLLWLPAFFKRGQEKVCSCHYVQFHTQILYLDKSPTLVKWMALPLDTHAKERVSLKNTIRQSMKYHPMPWAWIGTWELVWD